MSFKLNSRKKLGVYEPIKPTFFRNPILFCRYLGHLKSYRIGFVFKRCVWISVFRRKKRFVNQLHRPQVTTILVMEIHSCVFFGTPCRWSHKNQKRAEETKPNGATQTEIEEKLKLKSPSQMKDGTTQALHVCDV